MDITSPCHNAPIYVTLRTEGRAYLQFDVPDEIWCSQEGCTNTWDANGTADKWNRYERSKA